MYYQTVFIFLLHWLTKLFAINEFNFERDKQKFVRSEFWNFYVRLWHLFYLYPMCAIGIACYYRERPNQGLDYYRLSFRMIQSMCALRYFGIALSGWTLLRHHRCLQDLMNLFLQLCKTHIQLFGRSVHVPLHCWIILFLRELGLLALVMHIIPWNYWLFTIHFVRATILFQWTDVAMLLHLQLTQSLALRLEQSVKGCSAERLQYLKYFEKILILRRSMQRLCYASNTTRLAIEIILAIHFGLTNYWLKRENSLFIILLFSLLMSNMLDIIKMARCICGMERKILNRLYLDELYRLLRRPKSVRSWRMEKVNNCSDITSYYSF